MFFIDESGSIPTYLDKRQKNRYFVITFVHTKDPRKLERVYRNALRDLRKHYNKFFSSLPNPNEMKGSEAHPFMKLYIFQKLIRSTDIKIGHMVVDNQLIDEKFRRVPGRAFNYLIKIMMSNFPLTASDKQDLILKIDNRNSAIESLKSLEDYLYNEMVIHSGIVNNVSVEYIESQHNFGVQVADLISHTIYQRYRYEGLPFPSFSDLKVESSLRYYETYEYLYNSLRPFIRTGFLYPPNQSAVEVAYRR